MSENVSYEVFEVIFLQDYKNMKLKFMRKSLRNLFAKHLYNRVSY